MRRPHVVFTVSGPPVDFETTGHIYMHDEPRNLVTYEVSRTNIMDTHDYSFRIVGVSNPTEPYDTQKHLKGVFAATATPKDGCVRIRLRQHPRSRKLLRQVAESNPQHVLRTATVNESLLPSELRHAG